MQTTRLDGLYCLLITLFLAPEAIKTFSEDAVINIVSSTLHDNAGSIFYNPTFNPIDKLVELYEENKRLYERMLKEKDAVIEKLLGERK